MTLSVQQLWCYPLKSAQGLALSHARLDRFGLAGDRRWVLVDDAGRFVSQRQCARMGALQVQAEADHITLGGYDQPPLQAIAQPDRPVMVDIWGDQVLGHGVAPIVDQQVSDWLGRSVRLVYCPAQAQRAVDPDYAGDGHLTAFSDGFPLLVISQASIDALSVAWGAPIDVRRFRPNVVIGGDCAPFAEDHWRQIQLGDVVLDLVKPCSRCVIPSLDPDSQQPTEGFLAFLAAQRRKANGKVYVGQNAIFRGTLAQHGGLVQTDWQNQDEQGQAPFLSKGQPMTVLA
jgi:uncharacterized protein YcbX